MATGSLQDSQKASVLKMLNLSGPDEQKPWGDSQMWKVLLFDKYCQEVIAPLLKIGSLRNHGVTLHLQITTERHPVPEVPAVYFIEPTEDNIKRICMDLKANLYESCYINFASAVPRVLLEELARGAHAAGAANRVLSVVDRYTSFVSLSPSLFSLNLPSTYSSLHAGSITEEDIMRYVERIVDGLLSVCITAKALPVIRAPPGHVAEFVARRLDERIRELLAKGGGTTAELFSGAAVGGPRPSSEGPGASSQKMLVAILDRDIDLVTMLHHTWTYQAMAHDVLGMRLNRVTVPVEPTGGDNATPPRPKSYDVDDSDSFWQQHAGNPFPQVAESVHNSIEEFNQKRSDMAKTDDGMGGMDGGGLSDGLAAAINALPEMTEKKRSIDMHTNIATALLNEVKARELDRYYEMEDQFASTSISTSVSELEKLIRDNGRGTVMDKTRALMVLYLSKPSIQDAQLKSLSDALVAAGGDPAGLGFLKHLASIRQMSVPMGPAPTPSATSMMGNLAGSGMMGALASKMAKSGEGLLAKGMSNLKNIITTKKDLEVCKIMDALCEQKTGGPTDNYLYLDPKTGPLGGEAARMRAPFRRAITFVVGGGNYVEAQNLQEWAAPLQKSIIYGSTDIVSPTQFVDELSILGQEQSGGGFGGDLR